MVGFKDLQQRIESSWREAMDFVEKEHPIVSVERSLTCQVGQVGDVFDSAPFAAVVTREVWQVLTALTEFVAWRAGIAWRHILGLRLPKSRLRVDKCEGCLPYSDWAAE